MGPSERRTMILEGDCRETLKTLAAESVSSIVTDPPYEIGFMGKGWDGSGVANDPALWAECYRVLKPGGHVLAFGAARTYHRMACAIEDAGFEIRDSLHWVYGSGFPKSHNVSKGIDRANGRKFGDRYALGRHIKEQRLSLHLTQSDVNKWFGYRDGCQHWERQDENGARVPTASDYAVLKTQLELNSDFDELVARVEADREVVGSSTNGIAGGSGMHAGESDVYGFAESFDITTAATDDAKRWEGWGTALKPAHEPIVMARKPFPGTVASNVLEHGTGALNIDGARIGGEPYTINTFDDGAKPSGDAAGEAFTSRTQSGRWPANVLLTHSTECDGSECAPDCPALEIDRQSGQSKSAGGRIGKKSQGTVTNVPAGVYEAGDPGFGDTGGASRFYAQPEWAPGDYLASIYTPKAGKRERNAGLDGMAEVREHDGRANGNPGGDNPRNRTNAPKQNHHPTVKPVALMRYLIRLVTPPNGLVLDPFLGSGTTAVAAILEGFEWIGCELTAEYLPIIEGRCQWARENIELPEPTLFDGDTK